MYTIEENYSRTGLVYICAKIRIQKAGEKKIKKIVLQNPQIHVTSNYLNNIKVDQITLYTYNL